MSILSNLTDYAGGASYMEQAFSDIGLDLGFYSPESTGEYMD